MSELVKGEAEKVEKKNERGATLVEYALLAALIAIACIAAMTLLGGQISGQFSKIADEVGTAGQ